MSDGRRWGLVATGVVAVVLGFLLLVTPTAVHHSGNCGSVVFPHRPTLNDDDTLEEQVLADHDCPEERHFRAGTAGVVVAAGAGVAVVALTRVRGRR